ncbi:MAG: transketolase [Nevskiales bacterium]
MSAQPAATSPSAAPSRRVLANAIRALAMDAVQQANSGHPGMPMGMADIAEVLWRHHLKHNPANPKWPGRDRFVISNGHGSMLLYALLHLTGYDLPLAELKNFRQLHSKTPGHPEYGMTPGVETTTGPLGQGLANAVGMALAERLLAAQFNRPGHEIVDHYTYVFTGDGCLMEGISHEASSLAGTWGLGKLIAFYDDNKISIDGEVDGWFRDDTPKRFEAYGWHVVANVDGHDPAALEKALAEARSVANKPSLICCKTIIGFGAPTLAGKAKTHGAPLGAPEIAGAREQLSWPHAPFVIPEEIYTAWNARAAGTEAEDEWNKRFAAYKKEYPELAAEYLRRMQGELPAGWPATIEQFVAATQNKGADIATRKASQNALNIMGPVLPELIGGSADLAESNLTHWQGAKQLTPDDLSGQHIGFGVREFGMSAIANGIRLHGGFIPYVGTFLVFSDYARNAVRLSALMGVQTIYVYTHDSIGLGEDGPTHQPIEHLASLRLIPNMRVWRPADDVETAIAWQAAIERRDGPTVLALTRQNVPHQARSAPQLAAVRRGGYVLIEPASAPKAVIIATGSEVGLAVAAAQQLSEQGTPTRVVSMPCVEVFLQQDEAYRASVLPKKLAARVAIEAGVADGWYRFVSERGRVIGLNRFGESAPGAKVFTALGFTAERVVAEVKSVL